jgi:hypothetical protein
MTPPAYLFAPPINRPRPLAPEYSRWAAMLIGRAAMYRERRWR